MKKIALLIPVFNKLELTRKCVKSLLPLIDSTKLKNICPYLVIIDDGSTDGSGAWIAKNYPEIVLLKGDGNLWWSGGVNMGAKYALEQQDTDYVLLWNNDIIADDHYFTELDKLFPDFEKDTIIGSKIYTLHPPDQIWAFGAVFNPRNGRKYMIGFEEGDQEAYQTVREVDWLPGMGTLVPVDVIKQIGYWDAEHFEQYHGDSDFTYRAKTRGYRILVYPQLKLWNDTTNTAISHDGKLSNLIKLLTDTRSLYHYRKNVLFLKRFSTSPRAYWPLFVSYYRLFGGFFKWKLLSVLGLKKNKV
jgi:GT2 family glycosyltransferase